MLRRGVQMEHQVSQRTTTQTDQVDRSRVGRGALSADQFGDKEALVLACMVARSHGVTVKELFTHSRSRAPIAATRQLAMYLMHVLLSRSLTEVGRFFGRDRTTVAYACRVVEDMRDMPEFDTETSILEDDIRLAVSSAARMELCLAQEDGDV